jgi:drug/metabolite transporter (DMT)-like permease
MMGLALGLIGICTPVILIALSAPKLPTSLTTIMASSELPSGVICAMIFMGDPISLPVGFGVVLVLVGIVVSEADSLRKLFNRSTGKTAI